MTGLERKILQIVRKVNPDDPIEYVRNIVKDIARSKLDDEIRKCKACDISSSSKATTRGDTNADILILSDFVLPDDKNQEAWNMIQSTLDFYHIDIHKCFFMNAVNCCPYLMLEREILYRIPNLHEEQSCRKYIDLAIEILKPKFMIILGNTALNSMINSNVDTVRGKILDVKGIPTMVTYSPSHLIWRRENDPDGYECEKNIFFKDFEKISEEIRSDK